MTQKQQVAHEILADPTNNTGADQVRGGNRKPVPDDVDRLHRIHAENVGKLGIPGKRLAEGRYKFGRVSQSLSVDAL